MHAVAEKIRWQEFREMELDDADAYLYELIDGEIMKRNYPGLKHQRTLVQLLVQFNSFVVERKLGQVLPAPFGVILDEFNDVQPDLIFVSENQKSIVREDGIHGVPELLVEIISPTSVTRDRVRKKAVYERLGVAEFWLVDPQNGSVEVYERTESGYELFSDSETSPVVKSKVLAGLEVDAKALFA